MNFSEYPILDFDPNPRAILEPSENLTKQDVPEHMVFCFFREVIEEVIAETGAKQVFSLLSEHTEYPIYETSFQGKRLGFMHPSIGSPNAAGLMEEAIAIGFRHFMACGGCGVLDETLAVGHLLVPVSAIRGEGTSYHYLAPSAEVAMQSKSVQIIEDVLASHSLPYLLTKTWTTDAIYRETAAKVAKYRGEGATCVEMEASAFMAVAQFRGVNFGQILYGGDAVLEAGWDSRAWRDRKDIRRNLFWLAAEACLKFTDQD